MMDATTEPLVRFLIQFKNTDENLPGDQECLIVFKRKKVRSI